MESKIDYVELVDELFSSLYPCFTFKEFQREFKKRNNEINLKKFVRTGEATKEVGKKLVKLVFYSRITVRIKSKECLQVLEHSLIEYYL